MALAYYCSTCAMYFRRLELAPAVRCPDCGNQVKPRTVIGGVVQGAEDANSDQREREKVQAARKQWCAGLKERGKGVAV